MFIGTCIAAASTSQDRPGNAGPGMTSCPQSPTDSQRRRCNEHRAHETLCMNREYCFPTDGRTGAHYPGTEIMLSLGFARLAVLHHPDSGIAPDQMATKMLAMSKCERFVPREQIRTAVMLRWCHRALWLQGRNLQRNQDIVSVQVWNGARSLTHADGIRSRRGAGVPAAQVPSADRTLCGHREALSAPS